MHLDRALAVLDEYVRHCVSARRGTMCPGRANDAAVTLASGVEDEAVARACMVSTWSCAEMPVVVPCR